MHLCVKTCGGCVRTRANTEKYFGGMIFRHLCQSLGGNHVGAKTCHACIRTRANTGKEILANHLCIGFVPGGTVSELQAHLNVHSLV